MGRRRGTEYTGIPEIVSPGQSIPKTQPKGLAAGGTGSGTGTAPSTAYAEYVFEVTSRGATVHVAGANITVKELDDINSTQGNTGYSFPGASADDNHWCVPFIMPANYDSSRSIDVLLSIIQEAS